MSLQKHIGRIVEIIYLDRYGRMTQRKVQVWSVKNGFVKAFCLKRQAPRLFAAKRILAVQPASSHAV
ncbi:WYL domain-containing protein [Ferviditalea candida]|uniref:WYL domain-containing protein n=1 Tax=Ferviditalea candida TaxID=3108399 RepID=A0ABU5ZFD6_9BACL|nr:hypothetical protein [Paenibacillaceae bacterium T2]